MQFFKSILIIALLAVSTTVIAQQKYENEIRISRDSVPTKALEFIDTAAFDKKIRWYKEYFLDGTSVEAKTRYHGKRYSIEFDPFGKLEDVEIDHRWRHAPEQVRLLMENYLQERFGHYTLDKLQFQYSGPAEQVFEWLHERLSAAELTLRYEVVIHTKDNGKYKRYEVLFDAEGALLRSAEFIPKNLDNIEY